MLTGIADSFVTDLTHVNRVRQQVIERASAEPELRRERTPAFRYPSAWRQSTCGPVRP